MAFEIIASLNVGKSAKEISEKIKGELNPKVNVNKPLRLIGNLDVSNTKKQIEQELQKITGLKIPEIPTKINTTNINEQLKSNIQNAQQSTNYYQKLKDAINDVYKIEQQRLELPANDKSSEYSKELAKQLKSAKERVRYNQKQIEQKNLYNKALSNEVKYLEDSLKRQLSLKQAEQATNKSKEAEAERIRKQSQALKQQQKDIDSLNKSIDSNISKMNQMSNRAIFRTNANDTSVKNMQNTFKRLEADYTKLKSKLSENLTPEALKNLQNQFNALAPEFDRVIQKSKQLDATFRNSNSITAFNSKINTLRNQIEAFMKNNPKALKSGYDTVFNDMLNGLNNCANSQAFNKIKNEFIETRQQINRLGLTGNTVFGTLKEKVNKFASWMGITMATATVAREIRGMFSTIVELDTALVDLNKTFTGTQTELNDFYYGANKIAKSLGVTTAEVINSTSSWQRLGYSIHEAEELAKTTSIFTSISPEMSLDEAQTSMVSIIKGFGIEANDALDGVASKVNIIGNKFALSNSDIAIALQKSASALKSANNTFEESIGLVVAGQEILQDADVVGQGLKTVSARVRGLSEDWQTVDNELVNIKGDIYDLTGVSIMEDEDTFKSTYDILKEISYVWDNITDKEQSNISELLFGKHRLSLGLAILDNFEQAEKAVKTMEDSSGNAMEEMTIIYDSLEYKINAFKETITEIAQSTITQDFLKSIVDDGTKMLETFVNAGNVIKPFFDVIAKGVSIIEQLTSGLGGLDKVLAGFAVNKMLGSGFKNLFGVDRDRMISLVLNMST